MVWNNGSQVDSAFRSKNALPAWEAAVKEGGDYWHLVFAIPRSCSFDRKRNKLRSFKEKIFRKYMVLPKFYILNSLAPTFKSKVSLFPINRPQRIR